MCHFPAAVKREASVETGDTIAFLYANVLGVELFTRLDDDGEPDDPGTGDWHLTPVLYLP